LEIVQGGIANVNLIASDSVPTQVGLAFDLRMEMWFDTIPWG